MELLSYEKICDQLKQKPCTWLVTGAAGFIGSHLVQRLLELNQKVVGVDNLLNSDMTKLEEVRKQFSDSEWLRFEFIKTDVNEMKNLGDRINSFDYVLHQAALGSVPRSIENSAATDLNNVHGFVNTVQAFKSSSVKRIVYASSSSVYGNIADDKKVESRMGKPLSPYAVSKLANELYGDTFSTHFSKQLVGLRYFNVFGPRQRIDGPYAAVIPKWTHAMLSNQNITVNGDGSISRDFTYVKNVVQANILAAVVPNEQPHRVYNVAFGGSTSLKVLASMIRDLVIENKGSCQSEIIFGPPRSGDIQNSKAEIQQIKTDLGYNPQFSLETGLRDTVNWYFKNMR